jgi:hypothetical protein
VQSIDANITEEGGPVRYYAEVPKKAESTEAWLADLAPERNPESTTVSSSIDAIATVS